jgi:hypothetical protein
MEAEDEDDEEEGADVAAGALPAAAAAALKGGRPTAVGGPADATPVPADEDCRVTDAARGGAPAVIADLPAPPLATDGAGAWAGAPAAAAPLLLRRRVVMTRAEEAEDGWPFVAPAPVSPAVCCRAAAAAAAASASACCFRCCKCSCGGGARERGRKQEGRGRCAGPRQQNERRVVHPGRAPKKVDAVFSLGSNNGCGKSCPRCNARSCERW